jgi:hypothetical protein
MICEVEAVNRAMDTHVLFIYLKMPAKTPTEKKMAILQMINHEKEMLYGKFKNDVENRMKIAASQ